MQRAHAFFPRACGRVCRRFDKRGIFLFGLLMTLTTSAEAYVGPGAGLTAIGTLLAFLGAIVLGIFGYYATRPINDRVAAVVDSDEIDAWLTVLVVVLPLLLLVAYAGFRLFDQAQQVLAGPGFPYDRIVSADL